MSEYFFVPGRMRDLCEAEIDALVAPYSAKKLFSSPDVVHYSSEKEIDIAAVTELSGGIYKAGIVDTKLDSTEKKNIIDWLVAFVSHRFQGENKVTFGVSIYGNPQFARNFQTIDLRSIKDALSDVGLSSAYLEPQNGELSSVQVRKKGLIGRRGIELVLSFEESGLFVGHTIAVQDFDTWSAVDYDRPGSDPKSGMLPPKVARMMVNLGVSAYGKSDKITVCDPFCGSGTILTESVRLGYKVIGSDNSDKALEDSRKNLEWILGTPYLLKPGISMEELLLIKTESAHLDSVIPTQSVDLIVTEPYMGPNFSEIPTPGKLERVIKGLEKLYIGSFKSFNHVLKSGGVMVFAEPQFFMPKKTYKIGIIDRCESFGYTLSSKILEYNREKALVGRRIGILKKK
jgi:tRNA G10  N-methylase Trm11